MTTSVGRRYTAAGGKAPARSGRTYEKSRAIGNERFHLKRRCGVAK